MATHKSAEKRHRQSLKRRERNRIAKATLRSSLKSAVEAAKGSDKAVSLTARKAAIRLLDKAAVHKTLHKKNVQRKISRLEKQINKLQSAAAK